MTIDGRGILEKDRLMLPGGNRRLGPDRTARADTFDTSLVACLQQFDLCSCHEHQPVAIDESTRLMWDGRLDNRDDLMVSLHLMQGEAVIPDSQVAAAAWRRFGYSAFARMLGDWSLAICDTRAGTVILARDVFGNRPLYYGTSTGYFAWSACLETLVTLLDQRDKVDESYIAGVLSFGAPAHRTPYRDIASVPAGHHVHYRRAEGVSVARFWSLEPHRIRYRDPRVYADRLRELFVDGVRSRLRADGTIWAELSGGMDSSAVVCSAASLIHHGAVPARAVQPVTRVFPYSPESNETPYVQAVEQWSGLPSLKLPVFQAAPLGTAVAPATADMTTPRHGRSDIADRMTAAGSKVLLTGELGDLVMAKNSGHAVALLEHLYSGHPRRFMVDALNWSWRSRRPLIQIAGNLLRAHSSPARRARWQMARRIEDTMLAHKVTQRSVSDLFGLRPEFVARAWFPPTDYALAVREFPISKRFMIEGLLRFMDSRLLQSHDSLPIWVTHPFSHRPLVEFVAAVPESVLWTGSVGRALMRQAFAGLLPAEVLRRRDKGYAAPAQGRTLIRRAMSLLERQGTWLIVERGYVTHAAVQHHLNGLIDGSLGNSGHVGMLIATESWLRQSNDGTSCTVVDDTEAHGQLECRGAG